MNGSCGPLDLRLERQRKLRPMIDRHSTNRTPLDIRSFEAMNQTHDIVRAT
jgi:hypothetical protein